MRALKLPLLASVLLPTLAFAGAKTSVQWGIDRTVTPPTLCVYDNTNICQVYSVTSPQAVADVRVYGAKCDGVTDDSTAIQAALYAVRSVILPSNSVCVAKNLQVPTNTIFNLNGSVLNAASGASYTVLVGSMADDGNGYKAAITNGSITDSHGYTLRTATLSATANPGDTTISVNSKTGFVVGNAIKIPMGTSPLIEHVTKITSISGSSSPYTIGIKDKIPRSVASATVAAGGTNCAATNQIAISGGLGPPAVLNVATASGGLAATTYTVLTPGLYDTSPGASGVATLASSPTNCVGTTANLTFATAASGTTVSTAYGNLLMDQCTYCRATNLVLTTSPINLQVQNTTSGPNNTTRNTIDNVNGDSSTIAGFYKATGVSNSGFYNLDFTAASITGAGVAVYNEGRDFGGAPPGGNIWSNVNAAQAEICMLQRSPYLEQYPLLVNDNCAYYADVVTGGQQLRFTEHWENYVGLSSGTGGVAMYVGESSLNVSLGNMYTASQVFSLFLDSSSVGTTANADSWGPTKWSGGGGSYNVGSISVAAWTPLTAWSVSDASGASLALTGNNAKFQQIGGSLTYSFTVTYPTTADGSNAALTAPIVAANQTYAYASAICFASSLPSAFVVQATSSPNSSTVAFLNGSTGANATNAQLSGATVRCTLTYPTS